jgi:hypothetical protein
VNFFEYGVGHDEGQGLFAVHCDRHPEFVEVEKKTNEDGLHAKFIN